MDGMNKMAFCVVIFIAILYIQLSASVQRPAASGRLDHLIIKRSADVRTCLTNAFNDYKHAVQRALQKHNTDIQIELQKHNTHQRELRTYNHALKQALKKYNTTIDACNTPPTTTAVACINSGACTRHADCCDRNCIYYPHGRLHYYASATGDSGAGGSAPVPCFARPPSCVAGRTDCTCL
ncbi:unnamed protein product [Adineta steineri]|uniref:Uncharacterized protein n=1 Tax=Adineta steineri TaxID=433720 RepID=A0A815V909_9BILA|nr:unnamed protein product [Adineta steineri]CAF1529954.1 unnamed protein product [Adineta steineri]